MTSDEGLLAAMQARMWHARPSSLVTISDPVLAYVVDDALMHRLLEAQRSRKPGAETLPPGTRFEDARDLDRPLWDEQRARERAAAFEAKLRREGRIH